MNRAEEIEAAAASWLVRREEPDWSADDDARLQCWLDQSFAHKAAYWRLECGWRAADRIRSLGPVAAEAAHRRPAGLLPWHRMAIAASIAGAFLVGPSALQLAAPVPPALSDYRTALGGHRQVALADGSTVELNTATAIRTIFSGKQRDVWLDQGEAFFSVRHNGAPFLVHAGSRVVTVLGTKFLVRHVGDDVRVSVIEGRVRVSDANVAKPSPTTIITRGDILEARGESTLVVQDAESKVERALAWRDGMLQFEETPLVDAAAEFNRYNERKIVVVGDAGAIPIGGSFKASNVSAFARLLHDAYGLRFEETATETKISG